MTLNNIIEASHIQLSDSDIESFDTFYQNNKYFRNFKGEFIELSDNIFSNIYERWTKLPQDLKSQPLTKVLSYKSPNEPKSYNYSVDELNQNNGTNFNVNITDIKNRAFAQINFARDYFPSEASHIQAQIDVLNLPDDKDSVYKYLNDHSLYNLRYIPNKSNLLNDYIMDNVNIGFEEIRRFQKNENIKFDDIINFNDKKHNFSSTNYVKAVNEVVEILNNKQNTAPSFRRLYQYHNLLDYSTFQSYEQYNFFNAYDDYPNYDDDATTDTETNDASLDYDIDAKINHNFETKFEDSITLDLNLNENDSNLLRLYIHNRDTITDTAYKLSKTFGSQLKNFINDFIDCNENISEELSPQSNEKNHHFTKKNMDDYSFETFTEEQFKLGKRINATKLKAFSYQQILEESSQAFKAISPKEIDVCSSETQTKLLNLLSILPDDFSDEKYKSLNKFIQKQFFYKKTDGTKATRDTQELQKIIQIWPQLTSQQENLNYKEILNLAKGDAYLNSKIDEFVNAAKINQLPRKFFDIAQSAYIRGLDTPRLIPDNYQHTEKDITIRFMDVKDPQIMFIGSGFSCQTITKAGAYPALSSVQDPFSRAVVIESKGKPIGLSWAWANQEKIEGKTYKSFCFDNIEFASYVNDIDNIMEGIRKLSMKIADEHNFRRVTIGKKATHYNADTFFPQTDSLPLPNQYLEQHVYPTIKEKIDYGDSANQCLIYENTLAKEIKPDDTNNFYVAHRDAYTVTNQERQSALAVGNAAYPWEAEFREENKNSKFMLLSDYQKNIVGYALYSDVDRHVFDVAVHPNYRHVSKQLMFTLFNHIKDVGGTWQAECREDTSMPLIVAMGKRGSMEVREEKSASIGINGEKLHKLYFKPTDNCAKISVRQGAVKN